MSQKKRTALIENIKALGFPDEGAFCAVAIEDFFDGNEDPGSIGCNLENHPGLDAFKRQLQRTREAPGVCGVYVGVCEIEEDDPDMWPFAERVYVVADAPAARIADLVRELEPDEVRPVPDDEEIVNRPSVPPNHRMYAIWWD